MFLFLVCAEFSVLSTSLKFFYNPFYFSHVVHFQLPSVHACAATVTLHLTIKAAHWHAKASLFLPESLSVYLKGPWSGCSPPLWDRIYLAGLHIPYNGKWENDLLLSVHIFIFTTVYRLNLAGDTSPHVTTLCFCMSFPFAYLIKLQIKDSSNKNNKKAIKFSSRTYSILPQSGFSNIFLKSCKRQRNVMVLLIKISLKPCW